MKERQIPVRKRLDLYSNFAIFSPDKHQGQFDTQANSSRLLASLSLIMKKFHGMDQRYFRVSFESLDTCLCFRNSDIDYWVVSIVFVCRFIFSIICCLGVYISLLSSVCRTALSSLHIIEKILKNCLDAGTTQRKLILLGLLLPGLLLKNARTRHHSKAAFAWQTKDGKLVLANSSRCVWTTQQQFANKLANCWRE